MRPATIVCAALSSLLVTSASAQNPKLPKRHIPPEVITGLRLLEHEFKRALAQDCAPERCFAKGCVYVAHTVVDQAATGSLPGLRLDQPGPGGVASQIYLTTAECAFAHESSIRARDARTLATRLKAKVSKGWTQVEVVYEKLQPLPEFIRESPEPPEPAPDDLEEEQNEEEELDAGTAAAPQPEPQVWEAPVAMREAWSSLLPHFAWMIGLIMLTFAALTVIWAVRRLGRQSPEEQLLMAQMLGSPDAIQAEGAPPGGGPGPGQAPAGPPAGQPEQGAEVAEQFRIWRERLAKTEGAETDPALQALVTDLLRTGERGLLAKAVMLFPDEFAKAFPKAGDLASAKFELAEFLKSTDPRSLPADAVFFEKLNRYALSSSLTAHPDTDLIRSLHDEFGATALADALDAVPARCGALLFALAPEATQHEAAGLVSQDRMAQTVDQLMKSNRMDPVETDYLLELLSALRANAPVPAMPEARPVSDRGREFSATAALSVLLPRLEPGARADVVHATSKRLNGSLPTWIEGTLYGEMLLLLEVETRTDLLLEVDVKQLAAWLQVQTATAKAALLDGAPNALRAAISASPTPSSQDELYALAREGRAALSAGLQRHLLGGEVAFQELLV